MTRFEVDSIIIPLYINSAQVFLELSIAALALSIAFREKVLGKKGPPSVSVLLLSSWVCYLASIGSSALYQYRAIKFLDSISGHGAERGPIESLVQAPGTMYGAMLVFFFLASLFLATSSARQLIAARRSERGDAPSATPEQGTAAIGERPHVERSGRVLGAGRGWPARTFRAVLVTLMLYYGYRLLDNALWLVGFRFTQVIPRPVTGTIAVLFDAAMIAFFCFLWRSSKRAELFWIPDTRPTPDG